jgi:hypothetical protein
MAGICTDFGAILTLFAGRRDELRQSLEETGVMRVAPNGFPTGDDCESFRVLCLGWPGSGFIKLVRETLSKNEVLPGLTYLVL